MIRANCITDRAVIMVTIGRDFKHGLESAFARKI
jgi:hypothetical protein